MSCNGTVCHIFLSILLLCALSEFANATRPNDEKGQEDKLSVTGNLYDVFKKRLDQFQAELAFDGINYVRDLSTATSTEEKNIQGKDYPKQLEIDPSNEFSAVSDDAYQPIIETSRSGEDSRSRDKNGRYSAKEYNDKTFQCIIEPHKRSEENENYQPIIEGPKTSEDSRSTIRDKTSRSAFKGSTDEIYQVENKASKLSRNLPLALKDSTYEIYKRIIDVPKTNEESRSTIKDSMYELYKKRLDDIGAEYSMQADKMLEEARAAIEAEDTEVDEGSKDQRTIITNVVNSNNLIETPDNLHTRKTKTLPLNKLNLKSSNTQKRRSLTHLVDDTFFRTHYSNQFKLKQSNENDENAPQSALVNRDYNYDYYNDHVDTNFEDPNVSEFLKNKRYLKKQLKNIRRRHGVALNEIKDNRDSDDKAAIYGERNSPFDFKFDTESYPSVLTKDFDRRITPMGITSSREVLADVAKQMNTSTTDIAKRLISLNEPNSASVTNQPLKKLIGSAPAAFNNAGVLQPKNIPLRQHISDSECAVADTEGHPPCGQSLGVDLDISHVLEKVLSKLERMQQDKSTEKCSTEGTPCDIVGAWNSYALGLRLDISIGQERERILSLAEKHNKILHIDAQECNPPRCHDVVTTDWKFMGSAIKQLGGPLFLYTQKREEGVLATFTGFCRTCGTIDTIFGSWSYLYPSKDCQDITASVQTKRDILRRYRMDEKRKERFKDMLYDKNKYRAPKC